MIALNALLQATTNSRRHCGVYAQPYEVCVCAQWKGNSGGETDFSVESKITLFTRLIVQFIQSYSLTITGVIRDLLPLL